jgi:hypothetical protein
MKPYFTIIVCLFTIQTFAQVKPGHQVATDSIKVTYDTNVQTQHQPKCYVDNIYVGDHTLIFHIYPDQILSFDVDKESSKIFMTTKNPANFNFLNLQEIRNKYIKSSNPTALYFLDGRLVKDNTQKINEKGILSIQISTSDSIVSLKDTPVKFDVIEILTRSKENLKKANTLMIRGNPTVSTLSNRIR